MGDLNNTLIEVGSGLGGLFDRIGLPLGTLIIILAIAASVGGILGAVASVIRSGLRG